MASQVLLNDLEFLSLISLNDQCQSSFLFVRIGLIFSFSSLYIFCRCVVLGLICLEGCAFCVGLSALDFEIDSVHEFVDDGLRSC